MDIRPRGGGGLGPHKTETGPTTRSQTAPAADRVMERVLKRFLFGAALGALAAAGAFPALAETAADKADESVGLP